MATLRLGDSAPDFEAQTSLGTINFHDWLGDSWGVLFSHPADFTPVCTTELGTVANYHPEFAKRNTKFFALSVDPIASHHDWIKDINETQNTTVNFPIIADEGKQIAMLYDMIHPNASENFTVRSVFVIGPDKKVKLTLTYPASTGRNFDELLRVIDSLQLTANYSVATPANWKHGDDVVITAAVKDEDIAAKFPKRHKRIKPYFRITPQPNKYYFLETNLPQEHCYNI
jgi:alkyl hydroperoxide reductase subunit AhpC